LFLIRLDIDGSIRSSNFLYVRKCEDKQNQSNLGEEAYRHEHLLHERTPMLLKQGAQDVYWGREIEKNTFFIQTRK
jgi:hypothetical protein